MTEPMCLPKARQQGGFLPGSKARVHWGCLPPGGEIWNPMWSPVEVDVMIQLPLSARMDWGRSFLDMGETNLRVAPLRQGAEV